MTRRPGGVTTIAQRVTAGVDTHKDVQSAAVLDELGRLIEVHQPGGDRHADSALWSVVLARMVSHEPTRAERSTAEGLSRKEIMRCLKRYVARELYPLIRDVAEPQALATAA